MGARIRLDCVAAAAAVCVCARGKPAGASRTREVRPGTCDPEPMVRDAETWVCVRWKGGRGGMELEAESAQSAGDGPETRGDPRGSGDAHGAALWSLVEAFGWQRRRWGRDDGRRR